MAEYDVIAKNYSLINSTRPLYQYATYPSFFAAIGDVSGKNVLDLACGEGLVAREMKRRGAANVVAVDLSEKMLELGREQEKKEPLGIEYRQGRVGELDRIGQFDVITAAFLLHYATTKEELLNMCRDIANNMSTDGVFVSVNNNPLHPTCEGLQYDNRVEADTPLVEGGELRISFDVEGISIAFKNYFWRKETYELVLAQAGLKAEWLPVRPTEEGLARLGKEYWRNFIEKPFFTILKCKKM